MGQAGGAPVTLGCSLDPGWAVTLASWGSERAWCAFWSLTYFAFLVSSLRVTSRGFFSSLITGRQFEHIPEFTFAARIF